MSDQYKEYEDAINLLNERDGAAKVYPKYYDAPRSDESLIQALLRVTSNIPESATREEKMELSHFILNEWYINPLKRRTTKELMCDSHFNEILLRVKQIEMAQGLRPGSFSSHSLDVRCALQTKLGQPENAKDYEVYTFVTEKDTKVTKVFAGLEELYTVYYPTRLFWEMEQTGKPYPLDYARVAFYIDETAPGLAMARAILVERLFTIIDSHAHDVVYSDMLTRYMVFRLFALMKKEVVNEDPVFITDKLNRVHEIRFEKDGILIQSEIIRSEKNGTYETPQVLKERNEELAPVNKDAITFLRESGKGVKP